MHVVTEDHIAMSDAAHGPADHALQQHLEPTDAQSGLPVEVTSFVGRRAERGRIRALFADNHLVTLTGFGGVGKTRLALKVAGEMRRAFPAGVVYVPLSSQGDPDLVPDALATALGLEGRSTRATTAAVVDYLTTRSLLLVLDNCEHVIDAVALLTDTLLRTCPDLRVLATSREPLRIQGESVHPVLPLSVPSRGTAEPLQSFESVALFLERSRSLVPDFELSPENRDAVAAVVSRLEGIPLAIELAAGRLRTMSPRELEQNLTERWDLLSRGSRAAPDRQRTMASCIEWSFDLCSAPEKELWARLGVFADGFELDAVRGICGPLDEPIDDVLLALVEKSIVIPSPSSGPTRFRMLPPIRHRGVTHLSETGDLMHVRRRHRDWYVAYAATMHREWMSPHQVTHIDRMRREIGNVRAALELCLADPGGTEAGLSMGGDMLEFGLADGLFREGGLWFDRLLARDSEPTEIRAAALRTAAWFAAMRGDLGLAAAHLEEGRAIAEKHGGRTQLLLTQTSAFIAMFSGDLDLAAEHFDAALTGFRELGDSSQTAHTLALTALNHTFRHDFESALSAHRECLALTEPVDECWYRSYSLWIAGLALWAGGRAQDGTDLQRQSLLLKRRTRDRLGIGVSIEALAWMGVVEDPARSAKLLGAAQSIWEHIDTSTKALADLHSFHVSAEDRLREEMGQDAYRTAFEEGRRLDPVAAVDFALHEEKPTGTVKRVPAAAKRSGSTPGTLTPRERQIAELVAKGLSNKDIATTLVISKRTAETHVEHILTKLGFNNRSQISAWMLERAGS